MRAKKDKNHLLIYANIIPAIKKNRLNNDVRLPNRFANAGQIYVWRETLFSGSDYLWTVLEERL